MSYFLILLKYFFFTPPLGMCLVCLVAKPPPSTCMFTHDVWPVYSHGICSLMLYAVVKIYKSTWACICVCACVCIFWFEPCVVFCCFPLKVFCSFPEDSWLPSSHRFLVHVNMLECLSKMIVSKSMHFLLSKNSLFCSNRVRSVSYTHLH